MPPAVGGFAKRDLRARRRFGASAMLPGVCSCAFSHGDVVREGWVFYRRSSRGRRWPSWSRRGGAGVGRSSATLAAGEGGGAADAGESWAAGQPQRRRVGQMRRITEGDAGDSCFAHARHSAHTSRANWTGPEGGSGR